ncbi:hypothetical protein M011DRAFT_473457 [Sporormia fimetaria CBS 119925]|uniref:Uncharacterized protein n=1 Tax=Sporormia fimetaria CBS 119925 TaxID=1340428 RepID=A0A6A6VNL7_9PLEO|nr:hypothetical protein M011DRAFT_473457 [Sporormia fimetaria CBS 119925]
MTGSSGQFASDCKVVVETPPLCQSPTSNQEPAIIYREESYIASRLYILAEQLIDCTTTSELCFWFWSTFSLKENRIPDKSVFGLIYEGTVAGDPMRVMVFDVWVLVTVHAVKRDSEGWNDTRDQFLEHAPKDLVIDVARCWEYVTCSGGRSVLYEAMPNGLRMGDDYFEIESCAFLPTTTSLPPESRILGQYRSAWAASRDTVHWTCLNDEINGRGPASQP